MQRQWYRNQSGDLWLLGPNTRRLGYLPVFGRHGVLRARQPATSFSPLDIAGLALWLDASQIVGLSDGDPVATWSDLSGNGNNATQATPSKRPTYETAELNGKPVSRFDPTDDLLSLASRIPASGSFCVAGVWNATGAATTAVWSSYGTGVNPPAGSYSLLFLASGSGGNLIFRRNTGTGDVDRRITTTADLTGAAHAFIAYWDGAEVYLRVDGAAPAATLADGISDFQNPAAAGSALGSLGAYTIPFGGDMAEFLVSGSVPTLAQMQQLEAYLKAKWGTP